MSGSVVNGEIHAEGDETWGRRKGGKVRRGLLLVPERGKGDLGYNDVGFGIAECGERESDKK